MSARHPGTLGLKQERTERSVEETKYKVFEIQTLQAINPPTTFGLVSRGTTPNAGTTHPILYPFEISGNVGVSHDIDLSKFDAAFHTLTIDQTNTAINFKNLIRGRSITFTLDLIISVANAAITFSPSLVNAPTIPTTANSRISITIIGTKSKTEERYVTLSGGGSTSGGLNTNLSNLAANAVPTVNLSLNDNSLVKVKDIDFDGTTSTIEGLHNLNFFQAASMVAASSSFSLNLGANTDFYIRRGSSLEFQLSGTTLSLDVNVNVNNHSLQDVTTIIFSETQVLSPVAANVIGYSNSGFMLYNVGGTANYHSFRVNGESIATLHRVTTNQGEFDVYSIETTVLEIDNHIHFNSITSNPSPLRNGDMWIDSAGLFKAQQNGSTVNVIGGSSSGLNTNLSNLAANAVPTVALDMNDQNVQGVKNLDFDGNSSTITGLYNLNYFFTNQSINSLSSGLTYSVNTNNTHLFLVAGAIQLSIGANNIRAYDDINPNAPALYDLGSSVDYWNEVNTQAVEFFGGFASPTSNSGTVISVSSSDNMEFNVKSNSDFFRWFFNGSSGAVLSSNAANQVKFDADILEANDNLVLQSQTVNPAINGVFANVNGTVKVYSNGSLVTIGSGGTAGANTTLSNLGTTSVNANINMRTNAITFYTSNAIKISATSTGMLLQVPSADAFTFQSNNSTIFQIQPSGGISLYNNPVTSVSEISFNVVGQDILSISAGIEYQVPTGDAHIWQVNNSTIASLQSSGFIFSNNISLFINSNYVQFREISKPSNPDANFARMYAKDVSGVTTPIWIDSTGSETSMIGGGSGGGANTTLSNLSSNTSVNENINMGSNNVTFHSSAVLKISGNSSSMFFDAPTNDTFRFRIDGDDVLTIQADGDLELFDTDIRGVEDIKFDQSGIAINSGNTGLDYLVPSNDFHDFNVNSITILSISSSQIFATKDLIFNTSFPFPTISFGGGQSSVGISGFANSLPNRPTGYIDIKVGLTDYLIPYYNKP